MKVFLILLLASVLIYSCDDNDSSSDNVNSYQLSEDNMDYHSLLKDSIRTKRKITPRFNRTDNNGLKQGMWFVRGYKNRIKRIETYVNDTLHGYWFEESGGFQIEGYYDKGFKQGYFWCYRPEHNRLNKSAYNFNIYQEFFYRNDTIQWMALPEKEMGYLLPLDGYVTSNLDSVYVKAIYRDSSIWFEGAYVNNKHIGVYNIYFPNGKLNARVDYENDSVTEYDSLGNFVRAENVSFYTKNTVINRH